MFLHLIIAAALLSPGMSVSAAGAPASALVCSIGAEIAAPRVHAGRPNDARPARHVATIAEVQPLHSHRPTTQLRR